MAGPHPWSESLLRFPMSQRALIPTIGSNQQRASVPGGITEPAAPRRGTYFYGWFKAPILTPHPHHGSSEAPQSPPVSSSMCILYLCVARVHAPLGPHHKLSG